MIDHTPRNETVRVTTGNAFDLVGERKQTNFRIDTSDKWIDESFEIKLRNHKKEPVEFAWSNIFTAGTTGKSRRSRTTSKRPMRKPSNSVCR